MNFKKNNILLACLFAFATAAICAPPVLADGLQDGKPVKTSADKRYLDMGDGTVVDSQTELMWMKQDYWQIEKKWINWYTAVGFARKMNNKKFAGYTDWRLPTPDEAGNLYNARRHNIDKDGDKIFIDRIFPKGAGWGTWTSKEKAGKAIVVSLKDQGGQEYQDKISGNDAFLRLVRGPLS